jgi:hypothetical protein
MSDETSTPVRVRWARLRFQINGQLLATPPESGELAARIAELAAKAWRHPTTGEVVRFSAKAIERWFYAARSAENPIRALERKVPKHAGSHPSVPETVAEEIRRLRRDHPRWSYRLVYDNLVVLGRQNPALGKLPGYASVCRYMKHHGLGKRRRLRRHELEEGYREAQPCHFVCGTYRLTIGYANRWSFEPETTLRGCLATVAAHSRALKPSGPLPPRRQAPTRLFAGFRRTAGSRCLAAAST